MPIDTLVAAVVAGASAGLTSTVKAAVKDAYQALKTYLSRHYSTDAELAALEKNPTSAAKRASLEEELAKHNVESDPEVRRLCTELLEALRVHDPDRLSTIGVDVKNARGRKLTIDDVQVKSGNPGAVGVRVASSDLQEDIEISGVNVESGGSAPKA
jgi:hypothetical protein